jgi:predicted ribosome quality control (RQC) complex YloA/Tae2 family protein
MTHVLRSVTRSFHSSRLLSMRTQDVTISPSSDLRSLSNLDKAQAMDYTSMLLCVNELRSGSCNAALSLVENVIQLDDYNIVLGLKNLQSEVIWLQLSWHPTAARIGTGFPPPRNEDNPYSFAANLRASLKGLTLSNIVCTKSMERIVCLEFKERVSSPEIRWRLILEIQGSRSNLALVHGKGTPQHGDEGVISACAYQVGASASSIRPLQTGNVYELPPNVGAGVFDPVIDSLEYRQFRHQVLDFRDKLNRNFNYKGYNENKRRNQMKGVDTPMDTVLVALFKGMSPNVASTIVREKIAIGTLLVDKEEEGLKLVFGRFLEWAQMIKDLQKEIDTEPSSDAARSSRRGIWYNEEDQRFYPVYTNKEHIMNVTDWFRCYYEFHRQGQKFMKMANYCSGTLKTRMDKCQSLFATFYKTLAEATDEKATEIRNQGDLIIAYTHTWKHGTYPLIGRSEVLECFDFESGDPVEIVIPEGKTPSEYASLLYKKAKKLTRSQIVTNELISKLNVHVDYLEEIDTSLKGILDEYGDTIRTKNNMITSRMYDKLSMDMNALDDIYNELMELEVQPILAESSNIYRDNGKGMSAEEQADAEWEEELNAPLPTTGKLRGKEKFMAQKRKSEQKRQKRIAKGDAAASSRRGKNTNKSGGGGGGGGKKGGKKKGLFGLTVLEPDSFCEDDGAQELLLELQRYTDEGDNEGDHSKVPRLVVGRSSKQNDRISFEVAKAHHLWFHAQGCPGSHCLLLLDDGQVPSFTALQFAADIAAYHSKGRGNTNSPVIYCSPKDLKKPSGAAPGMVSVLNQEGVLYGRPSMGKKLFQTFARVKE